jgi:hypothetical protein
MEEVEQTIPVRFLICLEQNDYKKNTECHSVLLQLCPQYMHIKNLASTRKQCAIFLSKIQKER